jgi:hypothetical protein
VGLCGRLAIFRSRWKLSQVRDILCRSVKDGLQASRAGALRFLTFRCAGPTLAKERMRKVDDPTRSATNRLRSSVRVCVVEFLVVGFDRKCERCQSNAWP